MKLLSTAILATMISAIIAYSQTMTPPEIREALNLSEEEQPLEISPVEMPASSSSTITATNAVKSTEQATDFIALATESAAPKEVQARSNTNNLITINLEDVALEDVVSMVGRLSNANIISAPTNLSARVTANLDEVEWKQALSSILSTHDFALKETPIGSDIYVISQKGTNAPEPLIVETIFLKYTTVAEVTPVVQSMLTPGRGGISTFTSRNALVIRSTENDLAEIKMIIKDIDIQGKQICVEALFMELSDSAIKQLGIRWDALEEFGVNIEAGPFSSSKTTTREQSRSDSLTQGDLRSTEDILEQINILDESPTATRTVTDTIALSRDASSDISDSLQKVISESQAAILDVSDFNIVLSALKKTDGISVVSNPKMIVANGDTNAYFRVGNRKAITKEVISDAPNQASSDKTTVEIDQSVNTSFADMGWVFTGIELKVVPTIKTDNLIEAIIEPSLTRDVTALELVDGKLNTPQFPEIAIKEIKTRFTLESGQTVAIGGLTDTSDQKVTSKIPLLGDIPLIGKYLFSHTKDEKKQVETIIFVTLSIADPRDLEGTEAVPDRARLVHKRIIRGNVDKHAFDNEIKQLNTAAEEKMKSEDEKNSSRKRK